MEGGKIMSAPSNDDQLKLEIFDSFSKTVMFTEKENDEYDGWHEVAGQADFDSF